MDLPLQNHPAIGYLDVWKPPHSSYTIVNRSNCIRRVVTECKTQILVHGTKGAFGLTAKAWKTNLENEHGKPHALFRDNASYIVYVLISKNAVVP